MRVHERIDRRALLKEASAATGILGLTGSLAATGALGAPGEKAPPKMDEARAKDWLTRWEANILERSRTRFAPAA